MLVSDTEHIQTLPTGQPCLSRGVGGEPIGLDVPSCFGGKGPFSSSLYLIVC